MIPRRDPERDFMSIRGITWNYQRSLMTVALRPNYHRIRKIPCGTKPRAFRTPYYNPSRPGPTPSRAIVRVLRLWARVSERLRKNNHPKMVVIIGMLVELGDDIIWVSSTWSAMSPESMHFNPVTTTWHDIQSCWWNQKPTNPILQDIKIRFVDCSAA